VSSIYDKVMRKSGLDDQFGQSESTAWISKSYRSYDRFDKDCTTYAMEASQHLLVMANMGLIKNWTVRSPNYNGYHWTAALQNKSSCETYRFDLNTQGSSRERILQQGGNPAEIASRGSSNLYPCMDKPFFDSKYKSASRGSSGGGDMWTQIKAGFGFR
jgi:hypothetical protein